MIKVKNLQKIYQTGLVKVEALRQVSFAIEAGEFTAIMGASGSGKSTLMNLLGLLDKPTSGQYILDNIDISKLKENEYAQIRNKKIGFVFQAFNLLPRLNALKNVELPMLYAGLKPSERKEKALIALQKVGLENRATHFPNELSGGQNQRVAIARALVNNPAIILADEPTGALDSHTSLEIIDIFQQLNQSGATIVLVTHELEIAQHAKRILVMSDGIIIEDKKVAQPLNACQELATLAIEGEVINP